jgi:uracil-DNA glycosylase family 4
MDAKAPFADCDRCPLKHQAFVPGYGPRQAGRVIVGEAPGEQEVRECKPFVGRSGKRLNKALVAKEVDRSNVYITNTVLCRPPHNEDPPPGAISACFHRLIHEVQGTMPRKVLALGKVASRTLTGDSRPIKHMRGGPAPNPHLRDSEVRVTYHPSGLHFLNEAERGCFDEDIGWLAEPEPCERDVTARRRAIVRDLAEQGHSPAEIGHVLGINEPRIRKLFFDEPPPASDEGE